MLQALRMPPDQPVVHILECHEWAQKMPTLRRLGLPLRWQRTLNAYSRIRKTFNVQQPTTYEQVLSMPLFGSQYVQHAGKPLDPAHHRDWFRNHVTTIGEVWHSAYGIVVPAPLLIRPSAAELRQCIPADWLRTLHQGKSDATAGTGYLYNGETTHTSQSTARLDRHIRFTAIWHT